AVNRRGSVGRWRHLACARASPAAVRPRYRVDRRARAAPAAQCGRDRRRARVRTIRTGAGSRPRRSCCRPRAASAGGTPRRGDGRRAAPRPLPAGARRPHRSRDRRRGRHHRPGRSQPATRPGRPPEGRPAGAGAVRQGPWVRPDAPGEPEPGHGGRAAWGARLHARPGGGGGAPAGAVRRLHVDPRSRDRARDERGRLPCRPQVPDRMTPAVAVCAAWSVSLLAGVVLLPGWPQAGALCIAGAFAAAAFAVVVRPLVVPLALVAACLGLARAELPAVDPGLPARAATFAGEQVVVEGKVADDPREQAGGYEALVEPAGVLSERGRLPPLGNVLVRVRGAGSLRFGDEVTASGRLRLPANQPGFDRRAYLAFQHA